MSIKAMAMIRPAAEIGRVPLIANIAFVGSIGLTDFLVYLVGSSLWSFDLKAMGVRWTPLSRQKFRLLLHFGLGRRREELE